MRTIFVLDRHDLAALRSGEPFEIQVGNGVSVTLQTEGRRQTRAASTTAPEKQTKRRTYAPKLKTRILKDAASVGVTSAAHKHHVSPGMISRWRREAAA